MPDNKVEQLEQRIAQLENSLRSIAQVDPQMRRTISQMIVTLSEVAVTDHDRNVDEGGAASYNVPDQFDGFLEHQGKLIGYYNK